MEILWNEKKSNKIFSLINKNGTRWVAFVSESVDKCQSEDSFVCFGMKPTLVQKISHKTRRGQGKEGSREKRMEESREETSRQNRAVGRLGQSAGGQELGPVDSEAGLANVR